MPLTCRLFAGVAAFCLLMSAGLARAGETDSKSIASISFRTETGTPVAWKELQGKKATVAVFLSFDCPMSNSYASTLADLAKEYSPKGVAFVGICPCEDDAATVAKQAKEFKVGFPIYLDDKLAAAEAFDAKFTPTVFVLDEKGTIRYSGAIDNKYIARLKENQKVTEHYLRDALSQLLAGQEVKTKSTKALGCHILRDEKKATAEVTYYKDVLPILQERCQSCHRPGEVAPFSLMTYKQAVKWAGDIKEYTQDRKMPPWKPAGGKEFSGDRRLSQKEIDTLAKWVDSGKSEGNPKDAPPPKQFPEGWYFGQPDLVLTVPDDFTLAASGKDHFRVYVLPTGLTEDKFIRAIEVRPGNKRIVHHTLNYFDATGKAKSLEAEYQKNHPRKPGDVDAGPGYPVTMGLGFQAGLQDLAQGKFGTLAGWAPGILPKELPQGTGYWLPKGADFVIQMHYHRDGKVEKDRTQIGLYFATGTDKIKLLGGMIPGQFKHDPQAKGRFATFGYIPAGDSHFVAKGYAVVTEDCTVYSVMPHMHLLGKSVKITMTPPKGTETEMLTIFAIPKAWDYSKTEKLIEISDWDYNWQETYFFKEAIKVKKGTRFDIEAVYDNSDGNVLNPHSPPENVTFGEQTTNEMLFGFLSATKDGKEGGNVIRFIPPALLRGLTQRQGGGN
jgi:peroxiredoxin